MEPDALGPHERELIRALGVDLTAVRRIERMPAGLAGGSLLRLTVSHTVGAAAWRQRLVMKPLTPDAGWLGAASGDWLLREAQFWERGLLQSLPAGVATGVRRWALLGDRDRPTAGALLMDDVSPRLLRRPERTPPGRLSASVIALLERLAAMHARYWQDTRLRDPRLGLMSSRDALLLVSPLSVHRRLQAGDATPYLALAERGWDTFFTLAPSMAAERLRAVLADPEPVIRAIDALPKTLLHGDVWGPNLGWLPPTNTAPHLGRRLLLLDWALALAGPATYDPLWLCGTWHALEPRRVLGVYHAFLRRRLLARGVSLPPQVWLSLADAGYLRTALTCGEALGRAAAAAPAWHARSVAEERVRWWARHAAHAADRLLASYASSNVSA
jgi:hypothetical protein